MISHVVRTIIFGLILLSSVSFAAGDAKRGAIIGETCLGCHGVTSYTNVYPTYKVPKLGGQHEAYIVSALKAYRSGERTHKTMHAQASGMTDQDIDDISAYLAGMQ